MKPGLNADVDAPAKEPEKQLYEVLPEVEVKAGEGGQIFGSKHGYKIPGAQATDTAEDIEISKQSAAQTDKTTEKKGTASQAPTAGDKQGKKPDKKDKTKYKVKF